MEQEGRQLYLFTFDKGYSCNLYRIGEPRSGEPSVRLFDAPLLTMEKPFFSVFPAFTSIGSRIFIIGGHSDSCSSNKVFIYDTLSSTVVPGPDLNSGKRSPCLFTFGSKIFALSRHMYARENGYVVDSNPRFEMWDTDTNDRESKWSPLPVPILHVSSNQPCYIVYGAATVHVNGSPVIFISLENAGTYCFEVDNLVWYYLGTELIPIDDIAVSFPHLPSICFGYSLKSKRLAGFRFRYEGNGKGFLVNEILVCGYENLPSLGGPPLECQRSLPLVFGPDNRVYIIDTGVDKPGTCCSPPGNRYVNVYSLDFEGINLDLVPRSFMQQKQIEHYEDKYWTTKDKWSCTWEDDFSLGDPAADEIDEDQKETTKDKWSCTWEDDFSLGDPAADEIDEDQMETTKDKWSCTWEDDFSLGDPAADEIDEDQKETTKDKWSCTWEDDFSLGDPAADEIDEDQKETTKVKLSSIWGTCFFGGPAFDNTLHVIGAIAM